MRRTKISIILKDGKVGEEYLVKGWVRTRRGSKNVNFIALNDGSTIHNLQIVADVEMFGDSLLRRVTTGAALAISGKLIASQGSGQAVELVADQIEVLGDCDADTFPLQPKKHSLEFLRENAHLRFRTNTFGAITRVRHAMIFAVHQFFTSKGFVNIHTPIITASDAEGAGEMFQVTTLDLDNIPRTEEGKIDFDQDFFGKATNLTVSGQLEGELAAMGMGEIYTFGPTFRAENSNTTRHLAEFWMIEPEMAFYDIVDNMDLAEDFIKYLVKYALENCAADIGFLNNMIDKDLINRLEGVCDTEFVRLTYTEGIEILTDSGQDFEYPVSWGVDLQSEHERYLVEKHFKRPVILTDYPKEIKAFYMKENPDGKTVRAMDILFPKIGEIIGGSQREENLETLRRRIVEMNMSEESLDWYLDTRRFGTAPHSGFGLGFERLLLFITGMANIRDVIPFPRTPKSAEF